MKKLWIIILIISCLSLSVPAMAAEEEPSLYQSIKEHLATIWNSDRYELLVPINTFHNPMSYSAEKRKHYNNRPWGVGIAKYIQPQPDRRYALAAMTFQDSFNKPEPSFFYSWQMLWPHDKDFRLGFGLMGGITFRENYHWIPIPGIVPTLSFEFKSFSIDTLYVPGFDVALTWLTWRF